MKPKIILYLALVLIGVLADYSVTAAKIKPAAGNGFRWGDVVGGFQMATSLDESNGIVHCRIRNATTNEMDYPSFDFGYFEEIHLEVREATNWTKFQVAVFPPAVGYSSAFPYLLKHIKPGQIVTDTFTRSRHTPWPVLEFKDYLNWSPGNTNEALIAQSPNKRLADREVLLTKSCGEDTFALDLIWGKGLSDLPEGQSVEARLSQKFRTSRDSTTTLYSPVFTVKGSLIQTYMRQNRELYGR
jgi:hypothetical protein